MMSASAVEVVALVAGVALHRVRVVAGVEVLEADVDALLLRVADDLLQPLDAVVGPLVAADLAALGVLGVAATCSR